MNIVETKRHPLKFYVTVIGSFLFFFAVGLLLFSTGIKEQPEEESIAQRIAMPIFGLLMCFMAIWLLYSYWRNAPKIIIDKHRIKIGNEVFNLDSIQDIRLTGKMPFRFIINLPMEGTAILFKDGSDKILFDDMYTNSHEVKLFLQQVVKRKQEFNPLTFDKIDSNRLRFENIEFFKGNQFMSLRGISLWGLMIFFIYLFIWKWSRLSIAGIVICMLFGTFWVILHAWLMHYVGLTKDFLVIRNHVFIWKETIYEVSNIKEIVFESQGQQPNCMRVITKDFRNKLYPAGTLSDRTWLEMEKRLEKKGIEVRNESVY